MKKLLVILTLCALASVALINVKAGTSANPDFSNPIFKSATEVKTTDVAGVATLYQSSISSYNGGVINATKLAVHPTCWVEPNLSVTDSDIRVVAYTGGSTYNWQGKQPSEIAKLYEKENPGWIVLAGTNGDFFHIGDNCEPLGTLMQETDLYKPYDCNTQGHEELGFFADGTYIAGRIDVSGNEYLQILKNGEYSNVGEIKVVDGAPSETGISLLTRFDVTLTPYNTIVEENKKLEYDLSSYKVVTVTYSRERFDRNTKKVFVKGVVTDITTNVADWYINDVESCSYLVSKDGSLDSLQLGDEVRCQCLLQNEWEDCINVGQAYSRILDNYNVVTYLDTDGKTVIRPNSPNDYVNCVKNRTIMGFKEDGTPIICVVEKTPSYGASYEECGSILKAIGCQNGFLFDGGGSSCLFIRNAEGKFQPINKQEDGSERSDANAILLVMRDPGFKIVTSEVTRSSVKVTLEPTLEENFKLATNIKVKVGDKTVNYADGGVVINGLEEETTYPIKVEFNLPAYKNESKTVTSALTSSVTTKEFVYPEAGLSVAKIEKNAITIAKDMTKDTATWIKDVVVHIGDATFNMGEEEKFVCTDLLDDTEYNLYFTYNINDPETGKKYPAETSPITVKTLSYDLPAVTKFETEKKDTTLKISYTYEDKSKVVSKAYILVNGEQVEITSKLGTAKVENCDFENTDYVVKLVLEYTDGTVESEEIKVEKTGSGEVNPPTPGPVEEPKPGKKKCGKKSLELALSIIALTTALSFALRKRH